MCISIFFTCNYPSYLTISLCFFCYIFLVVKVADITVNFKNKPIYITNEDNFFLMKFISF